MLFSIILVFSGFLVDLCRFEPSPLCESGDRRFSDVIKKGKALDVFYFMNDTKETIQLTWAGENKNGPGLTSDIYRSENNGKNFHKITYELGERVYIRRENGLQRHQNQRDSMELFVVCYDPDNREHSIIFVTKDGGASWDKSNVPFVLSGQLRFYPRKRLSPWILTVEEKTSKLFLSLDNGNSWSKVHENVVDFFWSIYDSDPDETFYVLYKTAHTINETTNQTLVKSTDFGRTWISVMDHVVRVWAPRGVRTQATNTSGLFDSLNEHDAYESGLGNLVASPSLPLPDRKGNQFLYVAHFTTPENQTTRLSVSVDGGQTFRPVYLPTVQPERFYSVLEVEDDLAFVHVDAPNDTGYGTLFTSDNTGQIFTESLRQHLYPNHAPVTDFYRVSSMRGTYLATRLNPDRTLHTVITHDRGARWHALGLPLNVEGACKPDSSNNVGDKHATPASTTFFKRNASASADSAEATSLNTMKSGDETTWESGGMANDSLSVDPSASKVCGLQISNQFSIRNRVIASSPLSISAAPGLILAHGHVATHLKNTPADVFVSSDGGYTWIKALDGPHHYQIANRGGLLVAVPADTLWPDVLRFSTDEGHCWHTIPLRTGVWNTGPTANTTVTASVNIYQTTTPVPGTAIPPTPPSVGLTSNSTSAAEPWMIRSRSDETVVFTGLVTEPGGRAMAAAVYGYGTVSQRWRVAVVDFVTNGMVTRMCSPSDYDIWTPHSSIDGAQDGCLLGVKQYYRRLKKGSLCINHYGLDPLIHAEECTCTTADFECDYGYRRQSSSSECVPDPSVAPDPCLLSTELRRDIQYLGYRRIPGDRCVDGWQPPLWNSSILGLCSNPVLDAATEPAGTSMGVVSISIVLICCTLLALIFVCYQRNRRPVSLRSGTLFPAASQLNRFISIPRWKTFGAVSRLEPDTGESFWPPVEDESRWTFSSVNANGLQDDRLHYLPAHRNAGNHSWSKDSLPRLPHMCPPFANRFRTGETDGTVLLEAEEVALPTDCPERPIPPFEDPLASPHSRERMT
ncbi:unnamed protein product [Dicrocoelium dendriticum]|nr:unnamed protein product [Dicrocoelium dendriticum]